MDKGNKSFEHRVERVRNTVKNIDEPRIKNALLKYGISDDSFSRGEELLDTVDQFELEFIEKNRLYYRAIEAFNEAYEKLKTVSAEHTRFCRLLLGSTPGIMEKLNLRGPRPRAFLPWLEATKQFYTSALDGKQVINTLKKRNISRQEFSSTLKELENLEELNRVKNIRKEERRSVNIELKESLKQAEKWRREIIVFATAGLGKHSPLLLSLGVRVKRK